MNYIVKLATKLTPKMITTHISTIDTERYSESTPTIIKKHMTKHKTQNTKHKKQKTKNQEAKQKHKNTTTQQHNNTTTQQHNNTISQQHKNNKTQVHKNTKTQRHKNTKMRQKKTKEDTKQHKPTKKCYQHYYQTTAKLLPNTFQHYNMAIYIYIYIYICIFLLLFRGGTSTSHSPLYSHYIVTSIVIT